MAVNAPQPEESKLSIDQPLYKAKEEFNDGREIELLHFVHSACGPERGSPQKVLAAIDEYGRTRKYLMNIGRDKAKLVMDQIKQAKPEVMVELGGYVGYSAIAFGAALRDAGGRRYYSIELNPEFAAVIASLADLAGLSDVVKVVVGSSFASLCRLQKERTLGQIDMLLLDHVKSEYTRDLKRCEEAGLVGVGTTLIADNVVYPGNPEYLAYVASTVEQKREAYKKAKALGDQGSSEIVLGKPNLVYETEMKKSREPNGQPDAVEITICTGIELE
ncbi:catechol o-methyltransferase [Diplogelasinospora grovesii]|uniref:catechol O-methyltransferase n=1 Tax=Diplogelasinospora grovesii TaxID=303347 RepID=A0AAN6N380_9PEZI|nr:catechol o-methyltransferase [Diplogelasinospora grovesii]